LTVLRNPGAADSRSTSGLRAGPIPWGCGVPQTPATRPQIAFYMAPSRVNDRIAYELGYEIAVGRERREQDGLVKYVDIIRHKMPPLPQDPPNDLCRPQPPGIPLHKEAQGLKEILAANAARIEDPVIRRQLDAWDRPKQAPPRPDPGLDDALGSL
jgi:hypothetical protein